MFTIVAVIIVMNGIMEIALGLQSRKQKKLSNIFAMLVKVPLVFSTKTLIYYHPTE